MPAGKGCGGSVQGPPSNDFKRKKEDDMHFELCKVLKDKMGYAEIEGVCSSCLHFTEKTNGLEMEHRCTIVGAVLGDIRVNKNGRCKHYAERLKDLPKNQRQG